MPQIGQLMDLIAVSSDFPELPRHLVERTQFLLTIEHLFEDRELVVVEGIQGIGKTTVLAQFAMMHPDHAITLFIKPAFTYTNHLETLLLDLCNQLEWALHNKEIEIDQANEKVLQPYLFSLSRKARQLNKIYYFVIDGLHHIPENERAVLDQIVSMLPFGKKNFRFLISGEAEHLRLDQLVRYSSKSIQLTFFSLNETKEYFKDTNLTDANIEDIYRICQRAPISHLASIKRILRTHDGDPVSLINDLPDKLPELFEIEWNQVQQENEQQALLLAILAHDPRPHSIQELASILRSDEPSVRAHLTYLDFVEVTANNEVNFISEAFRIFALSKLPYRQDEILDTLIDHLLEEGDSHEALIHLPSYYTQKQDYLGLINFLSEEYFDRLLHKKQSISFLQRMTTLGMHAAEETNSYDKLVQFVAQRATIEQLNVAETWRSQIQAHMALDDYEAALTLAQSAVLKEDRLHLLSVIARKRREQGFSAEDELNDQITQLYSQIDKTSLGEDRAVDIALDLMYSHPDLAIDLVEEAAGVTGDSDTLDMAFMQLSVRALRKPSFTDLEQAVTDVHSRIQDPLVRQISREASLLMGDYSSKEIIAEVEKIGAIDRRLFLLRQWLLKNREHPHAIEVVEFALESAIRTAEYSASARVFRELATPLPYVKIENTERLTRLISSFDAQLGLVEKLGPTEEYVRLQIILARAESVLDFEKATDRFIEIYLYIDNIVSDLVAKTTCTAYLLASITEVDSAGMLEANEQLQTLLIQEFNTYFSALLSNTADHYGETRGIVRALAKRTPDLALRCALQLNTRPRCNEAILELIKSATSVPPERINLGEVKRATEQILYPEIWDEALVTILVAFSKSKKLDTSYLDSMTDILNKIPEIRDAGMRCQACCYALLFLESQEAVPDDILEFNLLDLLKQSWSSIDAAWHRVDVGFNIVQTLGLNFADLSREYLGQTLELNQSVTFSNKTVAITYSLCLHLAIRAFRGLINHDQDREQDISHLLGLIERIPSFGERAELYSEIAMHYHSAQRSDEARNVVSTYMRPCIEQIPSQDSFYRARVISRVAPALFFTHKTLAYEQISRLEQPQRDVAYSEICSFIFRKWPTSDFYDSDPDIHNNHNLTYEDAIDICEIAEKIEHDAVVSLIVHQVVNGVQDNRNRMLTRRQKADIVERLARLIDTKFPAADYISHDGYKIVSSAQLYQIKHSINPHDWDDLDKATQNIPNLADRAYIWCVIAGSMPNRLSDKRKMFFEKALITIENMPLCIDKAEHYEALAREVAKSDRTMTKNAIQKAMQLTVNTEDPHVDPVQKRLVDFAYRVDPELASSLVSFTDDDPVRIHHRFNIEQRLEVLNLKKDLTPKANSIADVLDISEAAAMRLAAMNAGRLAPIHQEEMNRHLTTAAQVPLSISYPILSLITQNAVSHFSIETQAREAIRYTYPIFTAFLASAQLTQRLAARSLHDIEKTKMYVQVASRTSNILIGPGERDKAIAFMRNWFATEVNQYLRICDPYFGLDDLEILQHLIGQCHGCEVEIVTSILHQEKQNTPKPWRAAYSDHWRQRISDDDPPPTTIIIAGVASNGQLPVHDRWWLTKDSGLIVGTSFNGLGRKTASTITLMSKDDVALFAAEFEQYSLRTKRHHQGEKLNYEIFTLD